MKKEIIITFLGFSQSSCNIFFNYCTVLNTDYLIYTRFYSSPEEFLDNFHITPDIIFLDITCPKPHLKSFLDMISRINAYTVFVSTSYDMAALGYQYEARNYLLKPISFDTFSEELCRFTKSSIIENKPSIWVHSKSYCIRIFFYKLRYIEANGHSLYFHYNNIIVQNSGRTALKDLSNRLPQNSFFRCNNSYIVNLHYIESIVSEGDRYNLRLITGELIPMSRNKKKEFSNLFMQF